MLINNGYKINFTIGTKLARCKGNSAHKLHDNHKHASKEESKMGRMRENPRYNVISMRISDEEREHLENIMGQTHRSISDIMRDAMEYFAANYGQIEAQRKVA
jgi:hypothetical protein